MERILHSYAVVVLPVTQVFTQNCIAGQRACRFYDGSVPVGDAKALLRFERRLHQRNGRFLNRESEIRLDERSGLLVCDFVRLRFPRRLNVELLKDLNRQCQIVLVEYLERDLRLLLLGRRRADGVEQDVGVNEPHCGRGYQRDSADRRR